MLISLAVSYLAAKIPGSTLRNFLVFCIFRGAPWADFVWCRFVWVLCWFGLALRRCAFGRLWFGVGLFGFGLGLLWLGTARKCGSNLLWLAGQPAGLLAASWLAASWQPADHRNCRPFLVAQIWERRIGVLCGAGLLAAGRVILDIHKFGSRKFGSGSILLWPAGQPPGLLAGGWPPGDSRNFSALNPPCARSRAPHLPLKV